MKNIPVWILILTVSAVFADNVHLKNKAVYSGDIISKEDGVTVIETVDRIISVKNEDIEHIVECPSVVGLYKEKRKNAKTVQDHLDLSTWCFTNGFARAGRLEKAVAVKLAAENKEKEWSEICSMPFAQTVMRIVIRGIERVIPVHTAVFQKSDSGGLMNRILSEGMEWILPLNIHSAREHQPMGRAEPAEKSPENDRKPGTVHEGSAPVIEKSRRLYTIKKAVTNLRRKWDTEDAATYVNILDAYEPHEKVSVFEQQLDFLDYKLREFRGFVLDELAKTGTVDSDMYIRYLLREPVRELKKKAVCTIKKDPGALAAVEGHMLRLLKAHEPNTRRRLNAIETLGYIGSSRAVPLFYQRLKIIWGRGPRAHFFYGKRTSYVRDVTPVVATGATSFDPEIDTYTEGVVLDTRVMTVEWEIIRRALRSVTDTYMGNPDGNAWWQL